MLPPPSWETLAQGKKEAHYANTIVIILKEK